MKGRKRAKQILAKTARSLKRASPTILAVFGSAGVVATTILAVQATPKATKLIDAKKEEKGEKLTILETIQASGMTYAPTALVGIATIACIFGSNALNKRSQASMASAYALLQQSYRQYRTAAGEVYGEDADEKIKAQVAKDVYISSDGETYDPAIDKSSAQVLFYDVFSERYFNSTLAAVLNAEMHLNRNLVLGLGMSANDFYDLLGLDHIDGGDDVGWYLYGGEEMDGYGWLDFNNQFTTLDDGLECYIISTSFLPFVLT